MKGFKEFWSSMWDVQKYSIKWVKKHWKGYLVFIVVLTIPLYLFYRHLFKTVDTKIDAIMDTILSDEES